MGRGATELQLANGACDVLAGQLARSLAGATFALDDVESYVAALTLVGEERAVLSERARAFARQYTWRAVLDAYLEEIDLVRRSQT